MHLTKPAGVFSQLVGFFLFLAGLVTLGQSILWGSVILVIAAWMLWEGRQPAKRGGPGAEGCTRREVNRRSGYLTIPSSGRI